MLPISRRRAHALAFTAALVTSAAASATPAQAAYRYVGTYSYACFFPNNGAGIPINLTVSATVPDGDAAPASGTLHADLSIESAPNPGLGRLGNTVASLRARPGSTLAITGDLTSADETTASAPVGLTGLVPKSTRFGTTFVGNAELPATTLPGGAKSLTLGALNLNLQAVTEGGQPVAFQQLADAPSPFGPNVPVAADSDGDPSTADVRCTPAVRSSTTLFAVDPSVDLGTVPPPGAPAPVVGNLHQVQLTWDPSPAEPVGLVVSQTLRDGSGRILQIIRGTHQTYDTLPDATPITYTVTANIINGTTATSSPSVSVSQTGGPFYDTLPPTKPTGVTVTKGASIGQVTLSWQASNDDPDDRDYKDNTGVVKYVVLDGGKAIATVLPSSNTSTEATNLTLAPGAHSLQVVAYDLAGNKGDASDAVAVQIDGGATTPASAPAFNRFLAQYAFAYVGGLVAFEGNRFGGLKSVQVGGKAGRILLGLPNFVIATLPGLPAGSYPLTVTTTAGTSPATAASTVKYASLW